MGRRAILVDGGVGLACIFAWFLWLGVSGVNVPFIGLGLLSGAVLGVAVALKHTRSIEKNGEFRTTPKMFAFVVLLIIVVVLVGIYVFPTLGLEAMVQMLNFVYSILPAFYASRIMVYLNWERKNARHVLFDSMWVITKVYVLPNSEGDSLHDEKTQAENADVSSLVLMLIVLVVSFFLLSIQRRAKPMQHSNSIL